MVSSNSEANVRAVMGAHPNLVSAFSCGSSLFGKTRRFSDILRRLEIDRDAACAIGDEVRDIEAAHRARIAAVAAGWGYAEPEALGAAVPDFLARTPAEVRTFLTR